MRYPAIAFLAFSSACAADDFNSRVQIGRAALATPEGKVYEQSWGEVMHDVMLKCVPAGSTSTANLGAFTFVANISKQGKVSAVGMDPSTTVSRCFAEQFGAAQLPPPPRAGESTTPFPVADVIKVVP